MAHPTRTLVPSRHRLLRCPLRGTALAATFAELIVGDETLGAGPVQGQRRIDHLVLILTERGRATAQVDAHRLLHRPGSLALLAGGFDLVETALPGDDWRSIYLMARGPWATAMNRHLRHSHAGVLHFDQAPPGWKAALRQLAAAAFAQQTGWDWTCAEQFAHLAALLADIQGTPAGTGSLSDRLRRLVAADPSARWSLPLLARALGTSRSVLARNCAAETGMGPAQWLRRERCRQAQRLLAQGLSVAQVAQTLGFANPFHFSRVFTRSIGSPPSAVCAAARRQGGLRGPAYPSAPAGL